MSFYPLTIKKEDRPSNDKLGIMDQKKSKDQAGSEELSWKTFHIEWRNGPYRPKDLMAIRNFLRSMLHAEKARALGDWVQDHEEIPEPKDDPKVVELKEALSEIDRLIEKAANEGETNKVRFTMELGGESV